VLHCFLVVELDGVEDPGEVVLAVGEEEGGFGWGEVVGLEPDFAVVLVEVVDAGGWVEGVHVLG